MDISKIQIAIVLFIIGIILCINNRIRSMHSVKDINEKLLY